MTLWQFVWEIVRNAGYRLAATLLHTLARYP